MTTPGSTQSGAPGAWLWLGFVTYAALLACFVQLVLLPHLLPDLHDGHGLLIEGDWVYHHERAAEMAEAIQSEGWSAWQLRPKDGIFLQGINSAVYALTVPKPWMLIPLYAALHATSALILLFILLLLVPNWRHAIWGVVPFLIFPSAMITYTQIAKDAYTICGGFMFVYGWLLLARCSTRWPGWSRALGILGLVIGGATLTWTMRPYGVQVLQGIAGLFASVLCVQYAVGALRGRSSVLKSAAAAACAWLMVVLLTPLTAGGVFAGDLDPSGERFGTLPELPHGEPTSEADGEPTPEADGEPTAEAAITSPSGDPDPTWTRSPGVPEPLDDMLYSLAAIHNRWRGNEGASSFDLDITLHSAGDLVEYLPRAAQVGFLAPFPNQWSEPGSYRSTSLMRRVAAVEMLLVYTAWLCLAWTLLHWRGRIELWLVLTFSLASTLALTIAVPNLGSLYRVRYGPLMLLVGVGIAGAVASRRQKRPA